MLRKCRTARHNKGSQPGTRVVSGQAGLKGSVRKEMPAVYAPGDLKISFRGRIPGNTANTAASSHLYTPRTGRKESGGEEACPWKNLIMKTYALNSVARDPRLN